MHYKTKLKLCVTILLAFAAPALGNDSAASVGVGGIQLAREARISMEKERLTIGQERVRVEYEFVNETDQDITTEVAFPIPNYEYTMSAGGTPAFDDFRVWVEGREVKYRTEIKAVVGTVDRTELLHRLGVDIVSFGHIDEEDMVSLDVKKLSRAQRQELLRAHLIRSEEEPFPEWAITKTYHWQQTFPAHKILYVRHEYTPIAGFEQALPETVDPKALIDACVDLPLQKKIAALAANHNAYCSISWVDYILTTANSWKTPIKDFELIVERPSPGPHSIFPSGRYYVSFCWDGPVERTDPNHFRAKATNFVPTKELHIKFFGTGD